MSRPKDIETYIALGEIDKYRFIGIKPPLKGSEIDHLAHAGLLEKSSEVRQVIVGPRGRTCTIIEFDTALPAVTDLNVFNKMGEIGDNLEQSGGRKVKTARHMAHLDGHHMSTPFDPNASLRRSSDATVKSVRVYP